MIKQSLYLLGLIVCLYYLTSSKQHWKSTVTSIITYVVCRWAMVTRIPIIDGPYFYKRAFYGCEVWWLVKLLMKWKISLSYATSSLGVKYKRQHLQYMEKQGNSHFCLDSNGHFYLYDLTLIPLWIINHMPSKVWDGITYPFLNFNGCIVDI